MSYAIINAVFAIEGISSTQKMVALVLAQHANDAGECFPSMERMVKMTSLSDRAVQKAICELEKVGIITRQVRSGRATIYTINPRTTFTPEAGSPPNVVHPTPERGSPPPPNDVHPTPERGSPITGNLTGKLNRSLNNTPKPPLQKKPEKQKPPPETKFILPDWINAETWNAFMAVREKKKAVQSDYAISLIVKKLGNWKDQGHDPNDIINTSVTNSWKDVFEPKPSRNHQAGRTGGSSVDTFIRAAASLLDEA